MGKKSPPPKAPDLKPITDAQLQIAAETNEIAREQMGLSREQYAWFKENSQAELALAREQSDRLFEFQQTAFDSGEEAQAFAQQVGKQQMEAMDLQMGYAREDRQRYESVFLPMQDKFIAEANAYDTPERREEEASRAMVDIQRQSEAARSNSDARLRSMGLDPSQMRSQTLLQTQDVGMAANQALAGNAARTQVEDRGRAMRADALNIGMGLPSQATQGFAGAGAAGQGALSAGAANQGAQLGAIQGGAGVAGTAMGFRSGALNNVAALTGSPMQWAGMGGNSYGQSNSAYGSAANTMSQGFNNQMASWKAGQEQAQQGFQNVMSVASLAGGMMMAEGGDVSIARQDFPLATKLIVDDVKSPIAKPSGAIDKSYWAKAQERRAKSDTYVRDGAGTGKGGALSMLDRLDNAATAGQSYTPTNRFAGSALEPSPMLTQQQAWPPQEAFAEGGRPRARGALPVRQARDTIHATLAEGEFVLPADVVRSVGLEKLDRMVKKYHRENA